MRSAYSARHGSVGIIGASGFTGAELLRLLAGHPELEVGAAPPATPQAGTTVADALPEPGRRPIGDLAVRQPTTPPTLAGLDLVFLALPHGTVQALVPELRGTVGHVVDLAADFRLDDPALYPQWYGEEHAAPELLADFVYGLPELFRDELRGAALVAVPGCYPTAATLALAPLRPGGR